MLDRTKAPDIRSINHIELMQPAVYQLNNGVKVYEINTGTQEVIKMEVVFTAGRPFEHKPLAARTTAALLKEGTYKMTGAEVAETIDYYGGTLSTPINLDTSNVVLYCLTRHFDKLLPVVVDLITKPAFFPEELKAFQNRNIKRLEVDLTRNDVVAYRQITENIFGNEHVYGYNSDSAMYKSVTLEDVRQHFETHYHAGNCTVFISGRLGPDIRKLLDQYLGKALKEGKASQAQLGRLNGGVVQQHIPFENAVQSAIRIGCRLFNRAHTDFMPWFVLNTVLGGYFGSRLMNNVREDKGFTYNIFSAVDTMLYDGYFYIGTEVSQSLTPQVLEEIYKEIELLRTEKVSDEELEMVRSYLKGNLLTMVDGPFNIAELIRTIVTEQLPFDSFSKLLETIQTVDSETLRSLAHKYLKKEGLGEVVVG